ncbi:MAG: S8 family serine peptidase [Planctomycetota bacterium]|jgi:subtilisin family serine protease
MKKMISLILLAILPVAAVLGQTAITSDTEVVITIAGQEHRYQPRPDLGYVVKAENNDQGIASVYGDISLFAEIQIRPVGGRDRQGLWIIERRQSAAQNEVVIKTLGAQSQVQYVAPLFSCNGETEAIIPEIVIRVTSGTKSEELPELCRVLNLHIKRRMIFTEQEYLIDVIGTNAKAVFDALIELNRIEFVQWAAPNTVSQRKQPEPAVSLMHYPIMQEHSFDAIATSDISDFIPNDEFFPSMWHLHNIGQFGGTLDADINAPEAWEITAGDPNIVVAVVDTGVDSNHPDLMNNLVPGYDFYENDDLPEPVVGNHRDAHGTACAGLIAAEGNNVIGVVGVAWKCKVMPVRDGTGSYVSVADGAEGYRWAAANGADILSYSAGFNNPKPILHSAIVDITKQGGIGRNGKGCVILACSYNDGASVRYPATYPEVIAVGATDCNDQRWHYSNYGPELEIVAPSGAGREIADDPDKWSNEKTMLLSTDIVGEPGFSSHPSYKYGDELDYSFFSGTSASCPVAAGVAALILSVEPELTNEEVRHFLCRSVKDLGNPGRDDYYGWGRVDARAALDMVLAKRCDLNNDWCVNEEDESILLQAMNTNDLLADIAPAAKRDGIVDEQDLELMMQYWQIEIPEFGLVAHWKFDETEGSIAYNSAGVEDCNGILMGGPVWLPDGGIVEGALELDGIDDCVTTDFVLNPVDGPFSVFAWIKGGAPGHVVLSQIGVADWLLADPSEGNLMTKLKTNGRTGKPLQSQTNITDGNWHRIGLVCDGLNRTLYVDDIASAQDTQNNLKGSNDGLYIGCGKAMETGTFFSGLIDDVRIYNRAMSP